MDPPYRLFVNDARTILVRIWPSGHVEACKRDHPESIWPPPIALTEEKV